MSLRLGLGLRLGHGRGGGGSDTTAPAITNADLTAEVFSADVSEACTGYYVWSTSATQQTGAAVKAAAVPLSQTLTIVAGANTGSLLNTPTAGGTYYVHIVGEDAAGNITALSAVSDAYVVVVQWDLSRAAYSGTSFGTGTWETSPNGLFFKADGTKFWISGTNGNEIDEFSMSSAWDITTASFVSVMAVGATDTDPEDVFLSPDGTKLFWLGQTSDTVYMHALPTPWLLSSASATPTASISVATDTSSFGLTFSDDGLYMYIGGSATDKIYQWTMSVAWDITTATNTRNISLTGIESVVHAITFGDSGTKLYLVGTNSLTVKMYNLSTAWNISTAVISANTLSVSADTSLPLGLFWKPTGDVLFLADDTNNAIKKYVVT